MSYGPFCYIMMPFGLKNVGATYQRTMHKCFHDQIIINAEAYVNDIVVKSRQGSSLLSNLVQTFKNLRNFSMKLNPEKCILGVLAGQLLGLIVSQRGMEANPDKIQAIINLKPLETVRGVQKLRGCVAALSRFISRLGEKALPLYRLLKKGDKFYWSDEAKEAFADLKGCYSPTRCSSPKHNLSPCYYTYQ